jgi:hypothetical protein
MKVCIRLQFSLNIITNANTLNCVHTYTAKKVQGNLELRSDLVQSHN